ncbi:hypothetical protein LCGC14_0672500 [marine sediment metagenome]|uniref:Uncharacterized protein n=1 Tax=marine sediment metagenome TaxID=412755 RepID=A0A0F9QQK9_9ZZZZ
MLPRIADLIRMLPPITAHRGLLSASGRTLPSSADGYQTGCIFQKTDGGSGSAFYVNEGSVTSSNFVVPGFGTTITAAAAGTLLDFVLETEWISGTMIRADFATSTTFTGSVIGMELDFGTNVAVGSEQSVTGVSVTLPQMTIDTASADLKGLQVAVTGAIAQTTSGTTTFRGVDIATPAITQTAGTVNTHGVYVTGGTITSGTAVGCELAGAWTTGLIINTCTGSAITCLDVITISPDAAGTLLDFELETQWVSGTLIRADFGSTTTFFGCNWYGS